jgi:hypothetical protein
MVVSGQRLGKHVPLVTQQILNNATVGLQQWKKKKNFLHGSCRDVISKGRQLYTGVCEDRI